MLRYLNGHDLHRYPDLRDSMFRDRAAQFGQRMGWPVRIDRRGHERDQYDELDPLYVIWERSDGSHGGSMRFLPTLGRTMVAEHFAHLTGGVTIESPLIWECTRFCLAADAGATTSAALVLGAGEVMAGFHLSHFIGVFDGRMRRIYRRLGVRPDVIGEAGEGRDKLFVGLWEMRPDAWLPTLARVGISRAISRQWFADGIAARHGGGRVAQPA